MLPVEFSPDGLLIAAVRPADSGNYQLVLIDVTDQGFARTLASADSISSVRYSPDGKHICVAARGVREARSLREGSEHSKTDLYIVELDGSSPLRITYQGGEYPAYCSTGQEIAYIGANGELASIGIHGHNWRIITRNPPSKTVNWWMDDRKSFITTDNIDGYLARYAFTPPARQLVRLSPRHATGRNAVSPTISPDGRKLAYIMRTIEADEPLPLRIFTQEKDVPQVLVEVEDSGHDGAEHGLDWSADGTKLAVSAGNVWILNAETGEARKVDYRQQLLVLSESSTTNGDSGDILHTEH